MLLTRTPLYSRSCPRFPVRLACVRHAASVDSEPGSNSRLKPDVCRRKLADRHHRARKPAMALSCEITRTCARVIHLTTGTFNLIVKDRSTIPLRGVHSVQNGVTQVRIRLSSKPFKHTTPFSAMSIRNSDSCSIRFAGRRKLLQRWISAERAQYAAHGDLSHISAHKAPERLSSLKILYWRFRDYR